MRDRINVSPIMLILFPAAILLLPLRWVMAWSLAVAVHEAGHYIALKLCRVPVFALAISPAGVKMETGELQGKAALLCALAGPIAGFSLILFSRYLPCTAFCGWLQGMFNLVPVYPLDGGRALRAILQKFCRQEKNADRIEKGIAIFFALISAALGIYVDFGTLPLGMMLFIFLQKFLAKDRESRYNR